MTDSGQGWVSAVEVASVEIWYLLNPDTGAEYTVNIPNANGYTIGGTTMSFEPSAGGAAKDQDNSGTGTSDAPSISVASVGANALMVGALASGARDIPSAGANYTLVDTEDVGNQVFGSEYDLDTGASGAITVDFTTPQNEDYALIGVSFTEVAGGPTLQTHTGSISAVGAINNQANVTVVGATDDTGFDFYISNWCNK
jgi:hypothetical protein